MKIKPCPFCNSPKVRTRTRVGTMETEYQIYCGVCGTHGPTFCNTLHGREWATQGWNQIASLEKKGGE